MQYVRRTDGEGTPDARTVRYEYDNPQTNLPARVAAPSVSAGGVTETHVTHALGTPPTEVTQRGFRADGTPVSRTLHLPRDNRGRVSAVDGPRDARGVGRSRDTPV